MTTPVPSDLLARLRVATAGRYEISHELGRGGMATVFLARECALDRQVAIKVMAPQLMAVEGMAERFVQEARVAAALSHPHIIPIYAVDRAGDLLYFVMKYVAGRALDEILAQQGPLTVPQVRAILTQVGAALDAAHRRGVIHRDVKPANILLDEHGDAVVADFGIARLSEQPGKTQVGQTVGTPAYMSPEQCAAEPLTGAADQYALGVVAYELLTGAPPFVGDSLLQIVWKMVHEPFVPVDAKRPDAGGSIAHTVHGMLARQADERFASVADAIAALPELTLGPNDPVRASLVRLATRPLDVRASAELPATRGYSAPTAVLAPLSELSITLHTHAGTMTIDDTVDLVPDVRDAHGAAVPHAGVVWASTTPAVARVSPGGRITAVGTGRTTITAAVVNPDAEADAPHDSAACASLTLTVTRAGVRQLTISPRLTSVEVGDRIALSVHTGEAAGLIADPRLVAWTSSTPSIATVDGAGKLHVRSEGTCDITARTGGAEATIILRVTRAMIAAVSVTAPAPRLTMGERMRLGATPENTKGHPLEGYPVRWDVSDPGIAAISADGVLTALKSGQVLVAARVDGKVGTTKINVDAAPYPLPPQRTSAAAISRVSSPTIRT
ncbi:MAG: protein kinase domain-containing protein [Gemmatimonadaceae bacterium]